MEDSRKFLTRKKLVFILIALGVIALLALLLGLIPVYIYSSSSSSSAAATTNSFNGGYTNIDVIIVNQNQKRSLEVKAANGIGDKVKGYKNTTSLTLSCNNVQRDVGRYIMAAVNAIKMQDKIEDTINNQTFEFTCLESGKIQETLTYKALSGNETIDPSRIDGYYFNSTHLVDIYLEAAKAQLSITSDSQTVFIVQETPTIYVNGYAYDSDTGLFSVYKNCTYDEQGLCLSCTNCFTQICKNGNLCTIVAEEPEPEYVTVIDEYTEIIELGYTDAFLEFVSIMDPEEARLMLCNETDTCDNLEIKKFSDILV